MSEKLLIERLKSLAEEMRGPVREALLDAAMALAEADTLAARLAEYQEGFRESMNDHAATLDRLAEAEALLRGALKRADLFPDDEARIESFLGGDKP